MKLTKLITIGEYKFELILESKTVQAHSLMTDNQEVLINNLKLAQETLLTYPLPHLVEEHLKNKR